MLGYWARLDENQDIIDNEINAAATPAAIRPGDFAIEFTGTLELIG